MDSWWSRKAEIQNAYNHQDRHALHTLFSQLSGSIGIFYAKDLYKKTDQIWRNLMNGAPISDIKQLYEECMLEIPLLLEELKLLKEEYQSA